jgi:homocysteine S-methyltransferase
MATEESTRRRTGHIGRLPPREKLVDSELVARLANRVLVCDGAMGTMLHAGGVSLDRALAELNHSRPELVRSIHEAYIAAGADIVETNTFGASRFRLARFGLEDRVVELNRAGVRVAREAQELAGVPVLVAGSAGPVQPTTARGRLTTDEVRAAHREQVEALVQAGVDLLMLETFGDLAEMREALEVAREIGDIPIVAQMTFMDDGRTIAGDSPEEVAAALERLGATVIGVNCTLGPQATQDVVGELARHTDLPLSAQPNAGLPRLVGGHFQYTSEPDYFARSARRFVELGAAIVGGCCGTTPAHIEAAARAVEGMRPLQRHRAHVPARLTPHQEPPAASGVPSGFSEKLGRRQFVVACEVQPPAGGDAERAVAEVGLLREAGADALVVAPASSTRAHMSPVTVAVLLQQRLQIETVLTVTTWDKSLVALQADLLGAHALGLRSVICRTGVPPVHGDYPKAGVWDVDAIGLVQALRGLNEGRDCNGMPIRKPTDFVIGARLNVSAANVADEVERVRRVIAAGASFLVIRPVFDLELLAGFLERLGPIDLPLVLGIMPLRDFRHAEYLQHEVLDAGLPEPMLERMWQAGQRSSEVGIEIAMELIEGGRPYVQGILVSMPSGSASDVVPLLNALHG